MPISKAKYLPARLVKGNLKGKDRWWITFYQTNPTTNKRERFMPTFDMNRIAKRSDRLKFANEKIAKINKALKYGYPFSNVTLEEIEIVEAQAKEKKSGKSLGDTNIIKAIEIAKKLLMAKSEKKRTHQMHESRAKLFIDYLEEKKLAKLSIKRFTRKEANHYLNYITVEKQLRNRTYNNYLSQIRAFFNVLVRNEYINRNPFDDFPLRKKTKKLRRDFSVDERRIIAKYIYEKDKRLYYAILLLYYGFIRPSALREMKFSWIKVGEGIIQIPPEHNKSGRWKYVTIPKAIRKEIINQEFLNSPAGWYVFGDKMRPHASKQCGSNTMNYFHGKYLKELVEAGELYDIQGLSFYSWKDTGLTEFGEVISLMDLQAQAGHTDPKITMQYVHQKRVNKSFKNLDRSILD